MISDRAFIFHIHVYIPWGETLSLVPKSRSSVDVKYQGHNFLENKNGRFGGICVTQTHLVSFGKELIHVLKKNQNNLHKTQSNT